LVISICEKGKQARMGLVSSTCSFPKYSYIKGIDVAEGNNREKFIFGSKLFFFSILWVI